MKIGIVVQARLQSTRLPGKVLLDFYKKKTILEVLIDNLKLNLEIPIVVATSVEKADDKIEELCNKNNYSCFRGSENDVLSRFIGAAKINNFSHVIRVCSDNPFMLAEGVKQLADEAVKNPDSDYISFKVNGNPSILTHYGLWAELANVKALEMVSKQRNKIYHEHVTNYLYLNPKQFNLKWLNVSPEISQMNQFRLTVDDAEDFKNAQILMNETGVSFTANDIIKNLKKHPELLISMESLIEKHQKS